MKRFTLIALGVLVMLAVSVSAAYAFDCTLYEVMCAIYGNDPLRWCDWAEECLGGG